MPDAAVRRRSCGQQSVAPASKRALKCRLRVMPWCSRPASAMPNAGPKYFRFLPDLARWRKSSRAKYGSEQAPQEATYAITRLPAALRAQAVGRLRANPRARRDGHGVLASRRRGGALMTFTPEQEAALAAPLDGARIKHRQGPNNRSLSYLETWDVLSHSPGGWRHPRPCVRHGPAREKRLSRGGMGSHCARDRPHCDEGRISCSDTHTYRGLSQLQRRAGPSARLDELPSVACAKWKADAARSGSRNCQVATWYNTRCARGGAMSADYFQTIAEALSKLINSKPSSASVEELKDTFRSAVASLSPPGEELPICENEDEHAPDECDTCWAALEAAWDLPRSTPRTATVLSAGRE
jgi:hypothetical protein